MSLWIDVRNLINQKKNGVGQAAGSQATSRHLVLMKGCQQIARSIVHPVTHVAQGSFGLIRLWRGRAFVNVYSLGRPSDYASLVFWIVKYAAQLVFLDLAHGRDGRTHA